MGLESFSSDKGTSVLTQSPDNNAEFIQGDEKPKDLNDLEKRDTVEFKEVEDRGSPPPDRFNYMYFFFFYLSLTSFMHMSFIFSANDFWMYKFRNTSLPWNGAADAEHRTGLQSTVFSTFIIATAVPMAISLLVMIPLVTKTRSRPRIYICYTIHIVIYFTYCVLGMNNTDSWQVPLAGLILTLAGINSGTANILTPSSLTLVSAFPQKFIKAYTLGEGSGLMATALIQLICLLIGGNSQISGLVYFGIGTTIYVVALLMYIGTKKSSYFRYYVNESKEFENNPATRLNASFADFKLAMSEIWPIIAVYSCCIIGTSLDNVSSLIVSENRGDGSAWSETYFVPFVTQLMGNFFGVLGRLVSGNYIKPNNIYYILSFLFVRTVVYLPLYLGCNAFPRTLPIWFPHDWQYIIILSTFNLSNGFFTSCSILSIPNFVTGKVQKEIYYLLLQATLSCVGLAAAPLNIIVVKFIL